MASFSLISVCNKSGYLIMNKASSSYLMRYPKVHMIAWTADYQATFKCRMLRYYTITRMNRVCY